MGRLLQGSSKSLDVKIRTPPAVFHILAKIFDLKNNWESII